ncbi:MAG: TonB-dependent receptor plug domain-containing protein [bacterium]
MRASLRIISTRLLCGTALSMAGACALSPAPATRPAPCDPAATGQTGCVDVGYGVQARRNQTGAIGSYVVDSKALAGVGRFEQLLDGRIPGVIVERSAAGYTVRIRGAATAMYGGEPLIVIDGVSTPYGLGASGVFSAIDPHTVLRIDVLKDAGATSVYGSRGSNGVILITTRR